VRERAFAVAASYPPPSILRPGQLAATVQLMADCRFTVYTSLGPRDLRPDGAVARTAAGDFTVHTARQVRLLEREHGRVLLLDANGAGPVAVTRQSTNVNTRGASDLERRYGSVVAGSVASFDRLSLSHRQADALAAAVARSGNVEEVSVAVRVAALFAGGGANRWSRQTISNLNTQPARLAALAATFPQLAQADPSAAPPHTNQLPGHLVPRDLNTLLAVSDTVRAGRTALYAKLRGLRPPTAAAVGPRTREVLEQLESAEGTWIHSHPPQTGPYIQSGYKLHICGCRSVQEVAAVLEKVGPIAERDGLSFKVATGARSGKDPREIGVVVYLADIRDASGTVSDIAAAVGPRPGSAALPGDVAIADGYGLRYDMMVDAGTGVTHDEYLRLYRSDTSQVRGNDPEIEAASQVLSAARRVCDDGPEGTAGLLAQHLAAEDLSFELYDVAPGRANASLVGACAAALGRIAQARQMQWKGGPPEFLRGMIDPYVQGWYPEPADNLMVLQNYITRLASLAAAGVPAGSEGVGHYLRGPAGRSQHPQVVASAERPHLL
jgi:hypothetical protein